MPGTLSEQTLLEKQAQPDRPVLTQELAGDLIRAAQEVRERAYAPYSRYKVGAALLSADGKIYSGCNVENASFPVTICAERGALASALAQGERAFTAIAIVAGHEDEGTQAAWPTPCGMCRQALREFAAPDSFLVILAKSPEEYRVLTLEELLPESFGPENL